jgi:hypothetical protein
MRSLRLSATLVLALCLASCGDDDGDSAAQADADTRPTPPSVTATEPPGDAADVALNVRVTASFSAEMDPATLDDASFKLEQGGQVVAGTVTYVGSTAIFTPVQALAAGATFIATISATVKGVDGQALASPFVWGFVTGTSNALGPAPVSLGAAGHHVILAKTAITSVPGSVLTGDIGLSPAAASFVTGFSLVADATNVFSRSTQVVGKVFAANYAVPTPSRLTTAVSNMEQAYTDAASRPTPDFLELGTGNIGGMTLTPGLYKWTSTVTIPANVTLAGGRNDVWIFQTTGGLTMAAAKSVVLTGGAQARNVYWQIAGPATIGAGAHFEGVVLGKTSITLQTGATMKGRALAQTQVVLQKATITQP